MLEDIYKRLEMLEDSHKRQQCFNSTVLYYGYEADEVNIEEIDKVHLYEIRKRKITVHISHV